MITRCNNCFQIYISELDLCPYCGYEDGETASEPYFLNPGTVLNDRYIIGEVLGFGGFGITYKAWDKNLSIIVAIKEYYYAGIATRQPGTQTVLIYAQNRREEFQHFLNRFLDEARYTAKFNKNNNIVNVYQFFETNNTAYIVMEFLDGTPLNEFLKANASADSAGVIGMEIEQCIAIIKSVCSALKTVHADGIIHRDISPDNIMLCRNGKIKLFDFGAARFSKYEDQPVLKLTQVMKPGFSPPEQYQTISKQGPWTDIYALGATLYYMVTGVKPVESTNRTEDDKLKPPKELKPDIPDYINDTILRAMAVEIHLRFDSVDDFEKALSKGKRILNVVKEKKRRRRNRVLGLLAAVLVIVGGFLACGYLYYQDRLDKTLPNCTIEFWYALPESGELAEAKKSAYTSISRIFLEGFPDTGAKIILVPIPNDEYTGAIYSAYINDALPSLFESVELDESILEKAMSVETAVKSIEPSKVLFADSFKSIYPEFKQFPLGFNMPVMYTVKYADDVHFTDDTDIPEYDRRDMFMAGEIREYMGSTADLYEIQQALKANYAIGMINEDEVICSFTDYMSIGLCDSSQLSLVNKLLVFLLCENAQDHLHSQYHSGSLPLNRNALLNDYVLVYDEMDGFFDNIDRFRIVP